MEAHLLGPDHQWGEPAAARVAIDGTVFNPGGLLALPNGHALGPMDQLKVQARPSVKEGLGEFALARGERHDLEGVPDRPLEVVDRHDPQSSRQPSLARDHKVVLLGRVPPPTST